MAKTESLKATARRAVAWAWVTIREGVAPGELLKHLIAGAAIDGAGHAAGHGWEMILSWWRMS